MGTILVYILFFYNINKKSIFLHQIIQFFQLFFSFHVWYSFSSNKTKAILNIVIINSYNSYFKDKQSSSDNAPGIRYGFELQHNYHYPRAPWQYLVILPSLVDFTSQCENTRSMQMQLLPDLGASWYISVFLLMKSQV